MLAYMTANMGHHLVGHGGAALLTGSEIDLLTTAYFKSNPPSVLVDIGGPIVNLILGGLAFFALTRTNTLRFLLLQVAAYNLFWFAGTILNSAVSLDDWTIAVRQTGIGVMYQRCLLLLGGILCYFLFIQVLNKYLTKSAEEHPGGTLTRANVVRSFLFASAAAFAVGLLFEPKKLDSAFECLLQMTASLPILFFIFKERPGKEKQSAKQLPF